MTLQLYQVDQKSFLLDFKSLNTMDHPDATRVKRMTMRSMGSLSETAMGEPSLGVIMSIISDGLALTFQSCLCLLVRT